MGGIDLRVERVVTLPAPRVWPAWQVPDGARSEWVALQLALVELVESGRSPRCAGSPEVWWSKRPAEVERAVVGCSWCPLLEVCGAYALAAGEVAGTWGGLGEVDRVRLRQARS